MKKSIVCTFVVTLMLTGCLGGKSIQSPENRAQYIEQRACSGAQQWLASQGYKVVGIPCDAPITYVDAHAVTCGDDEGPNSGCIHVETIQSEEGTYTAEYRIYIGARHWGWENTLVHEYCHYLLHRASYQDWKTPCHQ